MNRYLNITSILILFLVPSTNAQEKVSEGTKKTDTAQNILRLHNNIFDYNPFRKKFFDYNSPLLYNNNLNQPLDLNQLKSGFYSLQKNLPADPLDYFKEHLNTFLIVQYSSQPNYDLGIIGKYLEYIKMLAAFYLAAKSVR